MTSQVSALRVHDAYDLILQAQKNEISYLEKQKELVAAEIANVTADQETEMNHLEKLQRRKDELRISEERLLEKKLSLASLETEDNIR